MKKDFVLIERGLKQTIKALSYLTFISAFLGAITQALILLLIAKDFWILSYFSASFIIIDGMQYAVYFLFLGIAFYFLPTILEDFLERTAPKEKRKIGYMLLIILIPLFIFVSQLNIYLYKVPLLIAIPMIGILFFAEFAKKGEIKANEVGATPEFKDWLIIIIPGILLLLTMFLGHQNRHHIEYYSSFKEISKEIDPGEKVNRIYFNDKYVFIKKTALNQKEYLIIKSIDNLFESKEHQVNINEIEVRK